MTLRRIIAVSVLAAAALLTAGCGDTFRPPVSSISPVGPAAQPAKYAIEIADPGNGNPGLYNMVDFSGDTILNTTAIGVQPQYLALGYSGSEAYVLNANGTVNTFGVSSSLQSNQIQTSTLFSGADANSVFPGSTYIYFTEPYPATPANASVAIAQGTPPSVKQELAVGANPVYLAGTSSSARIYAISQGSDSVTAIQTSTNTISNTIGVGASPVYGIMTPDNNRVFIMNQGDGTVSVINANTDEPDTNKPTITVGSGPVWADVYGQGSLLVTANSTGNSVSIVTIPLCSIVALPTNPNCDANDPTDDTNFGTVLATVPVGPNPQMVSILQDGTRAYVANFNATNVAGFSVTGDPRTITGFSISSNVATITANNDFVAGSLVGITGLSIGTGLNGGPYTVLPSGLSSTQFEISVTGLPNTAQTADSGTALEGKATVEASNAYSTGTQVMLAGLRSGSGSCLNGGPYAVLPAGLSATQFEVEVPCGTTATTTDAGTTSVSGTYGSVSVVDLTTYTVSRTIPFDGNITNPDGSENPYHGPYCHPNFIVTSQGTPTGKVYVSCPDGQLLTILETDTDSLRGTLNMQGYGVQVRMTAQ